MCDFICNCDSEHQGETRKYNSVFEYTQYLKYTPGKESWVHSPVYLVKFYLAIVKYKTGAWKPGMRFLFLRRLTEEDTGMMSPWEC